MLAFITGATIKGAAVILAALLVNRTILRRRSAASRHAVWSIALASQLALVLAAPVMPAWHVPVLRAPAWLASGGSRPVVSFDVTERERPAHQQANVPARYQATADARGGAVVTGARATSAVRRDDAAPAAGLNASGPRASGGDGGDGGVQYAIGPLQVRMPMSLLLVIGWGVGVAFVLLRYVHGTAQVASLARSSERVEDGQWLSLAQRTARRMEIDRPLTLLRGDRLGVPVTWGIVYPVVLLPEGADSWPQERREFVLLHEMAHVKRLDALTQVVAQLAEALFWFNPFVWYAGQQSRLERERACDDYVLLHGTRASFYADELLGMVRRIDARRDDNAAPAFAALAMARRSEFEGRMLAILDPATDRRRLGSRASAAAVFAALALTLPLAALQPFGGPTDADAAIIERGIASGPRDASGRTPNVRGTRASSSARASMPSVSRLLAEASRVQAQEPIGVRNLVAWADSAEFAIDDHRVRTVVASCHAYDIAAPATTGHTATVINDDDGLRFLQYALRRRGRCIQGMTLGSIVVSPDERTVLALPDGARLHLHERTPALERELSLIPGPDGTIVRVYTLNGRRAPFDAAAASWLARSIPEVLRESGVDAPARIARLRGSGNDIAPVLADIARQHRAAGKQLYYEHLLQSPLTAPQKARVVSHARRELSASREELAAVLTLAGMQASRQRTRPASTGDTSRLALFDELADRMSPTDRQHFIREQLPAADRELLLGIIRRIAEVGSDGDKTHLLGLAMPRYITADDELRASFLAAARTIESSGDLSSLLRQLAPIAVATCEDAMVETMRMTRHVSSDGDRATLLVYMAGRGMLSTARLRAAYAESARTIKSDGDFKYAMSRLLKT